MMKNPRIMIGLAALAISAIAGSCVAGILPPDTTTLNAAASSGSPALWWLDGDYATAAGSVFSIGTWNQLRIDNGHTFTADNMVVGQSNTSYSLLDVRQGSTVNVNGNLLCGQSTSVAHYSRYHRINVSGNGALLAVKGNLSIGSGGAWLVTDNALNISDNGLVIVNSDKDGTGGFWASNHWSYGNSWLELNGGTLAIWGDSTGGFVAGSGILTSIKVWDEDSESFQRVAYYESTTWRSTDFLDLLSVNYIADSGQAAALGLGQEMVGFTVVQNVPEPATVLLLGLGAAVVLRRTRRA